MTFVRVQTTGTLSFGFIAIAVSGILKVIMQYSVGFLPSYLRDLLTGRSLFIFT
jgi:hypothetical protein